MQPDISGLATSPFSPVTNTRLRDSAGSGSLAGRLTGMVFVADDLGAWLVGVLADAGRKKLTTLRRRAQ